MRIERVVLDTNVVVSAAISLTGKPKRSVVWCVSNAEIVTSPKLLGELRRKVEQPRLARFWSIGEPNATIAALAEVATLVTPTPIPPICRDPDDDMVLATAIAGEVDGIVTGDQDLLVLDPFRAIRILTPTDFLVAAEGG